MSLSNWLSRIAATLKTRGGLVISGLLLGISVLYCLASLAVILGGTSGSYVVTASFYGVYAFIGHSISFLQISTLFIWIAICSLLMIINLKYWWSVLKYEILATVLFAVGTYIGGLGLQFTNGDSVTYHSRSYHLYYLVDWEDRIGFYSLLDCDQFGLSCNRIFNSDHKYSKMDTNAQIKVDETAQALSVVVENKTIYSRPLE